MQVILIEPFFHRAGHFPEEVIQLGLALDAAEAKVKVVTPRPVVLKSLVFQAAMVPDWLIKIAPKTSGIVQAAVDSLTIWLCMRAAVKAASADTVLVVVSGRFLAFFAAAALTRDRAWVFFSRDFSRFQQPATIDRLLHGPTHVLARAAGKRNRVSLISLVDPDIASPEDSFGLPMVYIPPVGVRAPAQLPRRSEARLRLGLPPDDPMLLVFGLGHSGKGYGVIFYALKHLHSPLKIVFTGSVPKESPEQPPDLKQRFDREDRGLVRDGWIPREEVPDYFAAADGLLLSYRSGYVVDSGVLCECVAMDLPQLGSEQGSIGHYVLPGKPGIHVVLHRHGRKR